MKNTISLVIAVLTLIAMLYGGWKWANGQMDAWAQAVEMRVQQSVSDKIDNQQESLDRLMCAVYYGKPKMVCDCEAIEAAQPVPHIERCEEVQRLLDTGRTDAAAALAQADST